MTETLTELVIASVLFLAVHFGLSSNPLRARLIERWGAEKFRGIYAVISAVLFVWMNVAFAMAPFVDVWIPGDWTRILSIVLMPIATILLVCGYFAQRTRMERGGDVAGRRESGRARHG